MRRVALVGTALVALVAATSCGGDTGSAPTAPTGCGPAAAAQRRPPAALTPVQLVERYMAALGRRDFPAAEQATLPCTVRQRRSIEALWKFVVGLPQGHERVVVRRGGRREAARGRAGGAAAARATHVHVSVFVRFGRPPYSAWISAAERTLLISRRSGRWFVNADVTRTRRGDLAVYGLSSYKRPLATSGRRATVVYSWEAPSGAPRRILRVADAAIGGLVKRYGGGRAASRPVLFLVQGRRQGERLAHVQLGKVRTPAGFEYASYVYVDLPEWENLYPDDQDSMVVHELTHVVTRAIVDGAPHSMAEGIAMYEEDAWRVRHGFRAVDLDGLSELYRRGFPSLRLWERRWTDWGLGNTIAIHYAYLDAMAMTHVIMTRHGGLPAFRRLGAAFRARAHHGDFTGADVRAAFEQALGVSFEQVRADAAAWAAGAGS